MFCGIQAEGGERLLLRPPPTRGTPKFPLQRTLLQHTFRISCQILQRRDGFRLRNFSEGEEQALAPSLEYMEGASERAVNCTQLLSINVPSSRRGHFCDLTGGKTGEAAAIYCSEVDAEQQKANQAFPSFPGYRRSAEGRRERTQGRSVMLKLPLPPRWSSAPHAHPSHCCRPPAGSLTLSLSSHASLKGENSVSPTPRCPQSR